eukprot:gene380-712_t
MPVGADVENDTAKAKKFNYVYAGAFTLEALLLLCATVAFVSLTLALTRGRRGTFDYASSGISWETPPPLGRTSFADSITRDENHDPYIVVRLVDYTYMQYTVTHDSALREDAVHKNGETYQVGRRLLSGKDIAVVSVACSGFNAYVRSVRFHKLLSDQYEARIVGFDMACSDNETHTVTYGEGSRANCSSVEYPSGFAVSSNYTCEQRCDDGSLDLSACSSNASMNDVDCEYAWAFEYHRTSEDRSSNRSLTVRCDEVAYSKLVRLGFEYNTTTGFVQRTIFECSLRSDSYVAADDTLRVRLYDDGLNLFQGTLVDTNGATLVFEDLIDLRPTLVPTSSPTVSHAPTTTRTPTSAPTSGECAYQTARCQNASCTACGVGLNTTDAYCRNFTYQAYVACADCAEQRAGCADSCNKTGQNTSACDAPYDVQAGSTGGCYDYVELVKEVCDDEPVTTSPPTTTFAPTAFPTGAPTYNSVSLNESARYNEDGSVDVLLNLSDVTTLEYTVHSDGALRENTTYDAVVSGSQRKRRRLATTASPTATNTPTTETCHYHTEICKQQCDPDDACQVGNSENTRYHVNGSDYDYICE